MFYDFFKNCIHPSSLPCAESEKYEYSWRKVCLALLRSKRSQTDKSLKFHSSYFREMRFVKRDVTFILSDMNDSTRVVGVRQNK